MDFILLTSYNRIAKFSSFKHKTVLQNYIQHGSKHNLVAQQPTSLLADFTVDNFFHLFKYLGKFKLSQNLSFSQPQNNTLLNGQIVAQQPARLVASLKSNQIINKKIDLYTSLSKKQLKGFFSSFLIKGYGKRAKKSKSLFLFRIGLRQKSGSLPKKIIPSSLLIKSKKKKTFFKCFTMNKLIQKAFFQDVIHLQGSSRKLPAFSYKDIGIRLYGKKTKKKVRRV